MGLPGAGDGALSIEWLNHRRLHGEIGTSTRRIRDRLLVEPDDHRDYREIQSQQKPETSTVRVVDGDPGAECQLDFGYLGLITDEDTGARRKVFALVITAVYSRHMFVVADPFANPGRVACGVRRDSALWGGEPHRVVRRLHFLGE